jgi:hypothetical protein
MLSVVILRVEIMSSMLSGFIMCVAIKSIMLCVMLDVVVLLIVIMPSVTKTRVTMPSVVASPAGVELNKPKIYFAV